MSCEGIVGMYLERIEKMLSEIEEHFPESVKPELESLRKKKGKLLKVARAMDEAAIKCLIEPPK